MFFFKAKSKKSGITDITTQEKLRRRRKGWKYNEKLMWEQCRQNVFFFFYKEILGKSKKLARASKNG